MALEELRRRVEQGDWLGAARLLPEAWGELVALYRRAGMGEGEARSLAVELLAAALANGMEPLEAYGIAERLGVAGDERLREALRAAALRAAMESREAAERLAGAPFLSQLDREAVAALADERIRGLVEALLAGDAERATELYRGLSAEERQRLLALERAGLLTGLSAALRLLEANTILAGARSLGDVARAAEAAGEAAPEWLRLAARLREAETAAEALRILERIRALRGREAAAALAAMWAREALERGIPHEEVRRVLDALGVPYAEKRVELPRGVAEELGEQQRRELEELLRRGDWRRLWELARSNPGLFERIRVELPGGREASLYDVARVMAALQERGVLDALARLERLSARRLDERGLAELQRVLEQLLENQRLLEEAARLGLLAGLDAEQLRRGLARVLYLRALALAQRLPEQPGLYDQVVALASRAAGLGSEEARSLLELLKTRMTPEEAECILRAEGLLAGGGAAAGARPGGGAVQAV